MANQQPASQPGKITIKNARLSYVHVWEPTAMTNKAGQAVGKPKYSVSVLIPKDSPQLPGIKKAIEAAFQQGIKDKWGSKKPINPKMPLRDGDTERPENPEYKGHYFVTASSATKPGIVDKRVQKITDESEVYSGVFANVNVNFYPFDQAGSKGVACGLNHIQALGYGEALSGRGNPEDEFEAIEESDDFAGDDDLVG